MITHPDINPLQWNLTFLGQLVTLSHEIKVICAIHPTSRRTDTIRMHLQSLQAIIVKLDAAA